MPEDVAAAVLPTGRCTLYAGSVRLSCQTATRRPASASTSGKYWWPTGVSVIRRARLHVLPSSSEREIHTAPCPDESRSGRVVRGGARHHGAGIGALEHGVDAGQLARGIGRQARLQRHAMEDESARAHERPVPAVASPVQRVVRDAERDDLHRLGEGGAGVRRAHRRHAEVLLRRAGLEVAPAHEDVAVVLDGDVAALRRVAAADPDRLGEAAPAVRSRPRSRSCSARSPGNFVKHMYTLPS